jgi:hypothetical protein|tara:strand:+ start:1487 stop:1780 length:294 start_codon:yes stop_codon:yes gene_type:complete
MTLYDEEKDSKNFHDLENGWWWYSCTQSVILHGDTKLALEKQRQSERYIRATKPFLCDLCNFVWTLEVHPVSGKKVSILHEDFPRRGLKKKRCQFCE